MTHITASAPTPWVPLQVLSGIVAVFKSFSKAMTISSAYEDRMREVARLNALTDAELTEKGLTRDEIMVYVFRDLYWD